MVPVKTDALLRGVETIVSELGRGATVTNPTGSVVAVTFCALASGRAARTTAVARVSDVDFSLMKFVNFLLGLWEWGGASGEFLEPMAGVFCLVVFVLLSFVS